MQFTNFDWLSNKHNPTLGICLGETKIAESKINLISIGNNKHIIGITCIVPELSG